MPFADMLFTWCPKCGAHALKRERPGLLTCPVCGLVFFLNVASAVAAIIRDARGRVLLTRRGQDPGRGLLDLPGGFVDAGESAEAALRRELREELGMEVGSLAFFGSEPNEYEYKGVTYRTMDLYFQCEAENLGSVRPLEEVQEILFLDPPSIPMDQIAFSSSRAVIRRLL